MFVLTHYYFGDVYLCTVAEYFTPEEVEVATRLAAIRELIAETLDSF